MFRFRVGVLASGAMLAIASTIPALGQARSTPADDAFRPPVSYGCRICDGDPTPGTRPSPPPAPPGTSPFPPYQPPSPLGAGPTGQGYRPAGSPPGGSGDPYAPGSSPGPWNLPMPDIWAGVYLGVNLGTAFGNTLTPSGGALGGRQLGLHLGRNWQSGQFVYGIEGDIHSENMRGTTALPPSLTVSAREGWKASLRARVGVAAANLFVYGTLGLAMAGHDIEIGDGAYRLSSQETSIGGVFGLGAEFKVTQSLSLRLEALRYDFVDKTHTFAGRDVPISLDHNVVRAGVTFHLN